MYRTKKDVDKHVENLISKLSVKEFKSRAYSIARLYYEVGDYTNCQRYVEQYLSQKDNNPAAYRLLGQTYQKLGQKEKALDQYKISLNIDSTQTSLILDICELLADDEVIIDSGRAKYWCEKAEAIFPKHPVTFKLREKLVVMNNSDPEALIHLLKSELAVRPKDVTLHARLLKYYLETNKIKEAFDHGCDVEFGGHAFLNNIAWYETLGEILKHQSHCVNGWLYQLLLLTVQERICVLSLLETATSASKSLVECNEILHTYDQAIGEVVKAGVPPGFGDFHISLIQHHRGQFAFHAATFLLKKAKKNQLSWRDASKMAAPLMLVAWQTPPLSSRANWLSHAPEKQQNAAHRWLGEGSYRCSQSGHYLLSNMHDKAQTFLDQISQLCSGTHWKDKIYETIFTTRDHLAKIKFSDFVTNMFSPALRLPRRIEVEVFDADAQREYPNSLHHFVWMLLNYKNYAHFKCTLFDMLTPKSNNYANCGTETLNNHDVLAFLYSATLTVQSQKSNQLSYIRSEKPNTLPANITDLLCSLSQMKWWDCAYKFSQNELGTDITDIRATLSRGIEVVRCIDNHGMDPELLCKLGRIFSELANLTTFMDEKNNLEARAVLYYSSAIPYLEKLRNKIIVKIPERRMFDYTHKELNTKELNSLLEESKLCVANSHLNDCEYEKVIEILSTLKSSQAFYHLSITYKKMALEENNLSNETKTKYTTLLSKAKSFAYKALEKLKETEINKNQSLYSDVQELIEDLEIRLNKIDVDLSGTSNEIDGKYYLDDNLSSTENDQVPMRNNSHIIRNLSSTPKQSLNSNMTNYRTAVESQILDTTRVDQQFLERIENQIKNLQRRDTTINDFMEQTKSWFDENRKLGNQIINTIHSNIQNTTDQFKMLKISVDQVKDQIDECRNECKDVGELKKQVAELKKEVNKLKKSSSEQNIHENELYTLDDDYRTNDNTSTFATQLPFTPSQVMPQFNQRLIPPFPVPPNPYQFYGQNLYNLYNQYSQFTQPASVPGAPPIFDSSRSQVNFPGMYPTPDQMYLDVAHLVPPNLQAAPPVPGVSTISTVPSAPIISTTPPISTSSMPLVSTSVATSKPTSAISAKEIPRSLPVNVVITSSDPLPTCTTTPAPILSVTIPSKHIKGTPHNYQIPMPSTNETKVLPPPIFSFPTSENKNTTASSLNNWNRSTVFKMNESINAGDSLLHSLKLGDTCVDNSTSVVDGIFPGASPNNSLNKSRTLSERSNTSVENYDPCPDFKPIIPLPAEVKVTTGEESETVIFTSRAKLYRFVEKQWKERGLGEMKLLKHNITGKVRVLMRREQIHKVCANHIITPEMEIRPMKNETKAYFWVANDFADEKVVLEKFCIRFKTADIAQQFYDTFEKARQESTISTTTTIETTSATDNTKDKFKSSDIPKTFIKSNTRESIECQPGKTVVGGFTFSSTPTFKTVTDDAKTDIKPEDSTTKISVFSGLTFKTNTTSSFNNLFNNNLFANLITPVQSSETPEKLNSSDTVEEFEPTVEFKPVIALPALIEHKTGEENETILFEHRAKLLRYDANSKEWKERGLGNIKLLMNKDNNQKVRLLMRREQVMKVCCNHAITKEMTFQKMPNMDKAVTWCAKDFSEGELIPETFCLRFKTVQICDNFIEAIKLAQSKIKDESKAVKEEQNAAKQSNQIGFGDKFKPKPGSWHCNSCYTNNLENFDKCACCEEPKPQSQVSLKESAVGWGDKIKPKPGMWECQECLIRNDATFENCNACNSPKDPTKSKSENKQTFDNTPKFNFGIPAQTLTNIQTKKETPVSTMSITIGWGDKFKPKEGTWECKQCFVRNESNIDKCSACSNQKNPSAVKKDNSLFTNVTSTPNFRFGITSNAIGDQKSETKTTSIFDGTGAHTFTFGVPSNTQDKPLGVLNFGEPTGVIFATPKASTDSEPSITVTLKKNDEQNNTVTPVKPALLPTPQKDSMSTTFGSKEGGTFDFVFKPKTTSIAKSPVKSPKSEKGYESDDNEYAAEDDEHHIHFSPVIPMPDKVEVVTGEENEDELYAHRAKLFRFISGEWKERGIGIVKILKHKRNGKLRILMRREQVLKICLNHALTPEIMYTPKDEKTWLFAANDFSEGELNLQQFCLRFQSKDIALRFKEAIDNAKKGKLVPLMKEIMISDAKEESDSEDVIFVSEIQSSAEEKQKAKELMLPENFFTYKNKEPCQGCRGCRDDNDTKLSSALLISKESTQSSIQQISTPLKTTAAVFDSPTTSLYGTPANFNRSQDTSIFRTPIELTGINLQSVTGTPSETNKTIDTTIFRSPLELIGSNMNSTLPVSISDDSVITDSTNKENTFAQKPNIFTEQKPIFEASQHKTVNLFGVGDTQSPLTSKRSILAAPKLSIPNVSEEEKQSLDPKPIFGQSKSIFGENKSLFSNTASGVSINKSIFGVQEDKKDDNKKPEVKSIFGSEADKPFNLFRSTAQGSLFGPGALKNNDKKSSTGIFGAAVSNSSESVKPFESGKSIFDTTANQTSTPILGSNNNQETSESTSVFDKEKSDSCTDKIGETVEVPLNLDNTLSFAALSSKHSGFQIQKNPDFKWEGAGHQIFSSTQKSGMKDKTNDNNTSDDTGVTAGGDEEYDPHYEPIVPLPDKIVVTTGEEDEEKLFGERCKLYRYDDNSHEWKERGIGEMKILYHPERKTYRLLLRREQVHKAVLNTLLFMDLELKPLKNSDRAWTWPCLNYAENARGEKETLAVRFKSVQLSTAFHDKVVECVRKLQAAAAQSIREEKEAIDKSISNIAPLRLPKHLEDNARADATLCAMADLQTQSVQPTTSIQATQSASPAQFVHPSKSTEPTVKTVEQSQHSESHDTKNKSNGEINKSSETATETPKQVHFFTPYEDSRGEEDYDHDYEPENEDYEAYYHDDDEESAAYYECEGEAIVAHGDSRTECPEAHVQVLFDQEIYSPKIMVTDTSTGEILADMLIHTDTEFQTYGNSCTWSGTDYTTNDPVDKTVTINFHDADTAMQFYDSCETSKAATYSSTDPES